MWPRGRARVSTSYSRASSSVTAAALATAATAAEAAVTDAASEAEDEVVDLDARILCADGACIGVIGPDGCCRECNRALSRADGERLEQLTGVRPDLGCGSPVDGSTAATTSGSIAAPHVASGGATETLDGAAEGCAPDLDKRELCADGACIGIIGDDGRCKICGTPPTASGAR